MNVPKQKHEQLQCGSYRKRKQHNEPIKTRIQHTWYWRQARETASDEVATGFVCIWLVEQVVAVARELFTTDSHKHSGNFSQNVIERTTCFEINGTSWNVLQNRNYDLVDLVLVSFAKWDFFSNDKWSFWAKLTIKAIFRCICTNSWQTGFSE